MPALLQRNARQKKVAFWKLSGQLWYNCQHRETLLQPGRRLEITTKCWSLTNTQLQLYTHT